MFQKSTAIERGIYLEKNFNLDSMWDCMESSADKPSDESDESLSEELVQDNRLQDVRETRKVNKTLYKTGNVNRGKISYLLNIY